MDAFQGCINNLYYIQTQDWTMSRVKPSPNSNWIIPAGDLSISYGDMVIVKCFSNGEIVWNAPAPDKEKTEKLLPQYYAYEEKTEYVPIYVDINSSAKDMPDEVGVFIDDECKGAAVVLGDLVEVPAYILDDLDENPEIEVRLHYDSKMSDIIPVYQTWNHDSEAYEEHSLIISKKRDYYRISIGDENGNIGEIPNPKFFISNYPNPFIPDTNIKYYTPVDSEISLDIFNVKGQKVISLVTGYQDKGFHQVNWDGKDNKGHTLSSGVYFAIMKYKGGQISHKMILMK